ncbi:MAG: sigma-70 family RNA polymerase sigma factor, partial [Planctomycetes bacterium]|nr:sigma-70 family RNA polymerase sigma factor [Planctomycetota bacterium]
AGSSTARDALLTRFLPRVRGLVHAQIQRRLRPQQHAVLRLLSTGDIVSEVLVDVLRHLDTWDVAGEEAFLALLSTLCEHRLLDQIRRAQAGVRDVRKLADHGPDTAGVPDAEQGPATLAANAEQRAIYREVLATFPERERALLALRLEHDTPWQELADRLAWPSADAARKAFHTVQAKLALRLRQRGFDPEAGSR